jgi:hypothetical protein
VRSKNAAPWSTAPPFETAPADRVPNIVKRHQSASKPQSGAFLGSIALAVITLFAVGIGVFAYLRAEEAESRMLAYMKRHDEVAGQRDKLQSSIAALAAKVGHLGVGDPDQLLKEMDKDLARHGAQNNYPEQIEMLLGKIKSEKFRADLAETAAEKARKVAAMNMPNFQAQLNELQGVIEKKSKELIEDRAKSHELLGTLEQQVADLQEKLQEANIKNRQMARDHEVADGKNQQKIKMLKSAVIGLKEKQNAEENDDAVIHRNTAVGSVLAVNSGIVTLNIGRDKGVQRGMLFRIFSRDPLGNPKEEVAVLEALNLDERTSTCQIKKNDLLKPILSGDLAFNPLLSSGGNKGEIVAIVGAIDFDDDGRDDGDKLERIVKEQGGSVDMRYYLDGRSRGKITPRIKVVIMDMSDKVASAGDGRDLLRRLFEIRKEATELGIPIRDSKKFLREIGWKRDLKTTVP